MRIYIYGQNRVAEVYPPYFSYNAYQNVYYGMLEEDESTIIAVMVNCGIDVGHGYHTPHMLSDDAKPITEEKFWKEYNKAQEYLQKFKINTSKYKKVG